MVSKSISHWGSQSLNILWVNQPVSHSVTKSVSESINQSISLSVSQSFLQSITQLVGEYNWGKTYVQVHQIEFELECDKAFL